MTSGRCSGTFAGRQRLAAAEPGWTATADVLVVGSGIAGLTAALRLRAAGVGRVLVVTKEGLSAGSTRWAQGGIAAALGPGDTPADHWVDTLVAGAGICDPAAVTTLVTEGPAALRELIELGAVFDLSGDGALSLTREGGHHRDRIAHAGGDATGAEIQRALVAALLAAPEIEVIENALVLDLLPATDGGVAGATLHVMGEGQRDGVGAVEARAVVLASGGLGQVFRETTNPAVATGDGMALAYRAGAVLRDLEFVQFHPTVMYLGPAARGQQPLISEAVRGEGAVLVDDDGRPVMAGVHPMADLAPRDVVAKAITRRMHATGRPHVWLDATRLSGDFLERRFPTILATCRRHGVDPVHDLIPVAPACHYASGGIAVDAEGRSSLPGLYAVGEVACTGVHGANRLASNSLLEGLVFARRIAQVLPGELRSSVTTAPDTRTTGLLDPRERTALTELMTAKVGVLRSAEGLAEARARLAEFEAAAWVEGSVEGSAAAPGVEAWEATNLLTIASALSAAAATRAETRGSHWREDVPDTVPAWRGHLDVVSHERAEVTFRPCRDDEAEEDPMGQTVFADLSWEDVPVALVAELRAAGLTPEDVSDEIRRAIAEDLPGEDVTSAATIDPSALGVADLRARESGVVAGLGIAELVFRSVLGAEVLVTDRVPDGSQVAPGEVVMRVAGNLRGLLAAERVALNYASHLSGIATTTAAYVAALAGTRTQVLDTRKTLPGMRALQKYAVRCGGGVNHRFSLSDVAMVKDNHVLAAGGVVPAYEAVRERYAAMDPPLRIVVEVDTLTDLRAVLAAGCTWVLLDNMDTPTLRDAVAINAEHGAATGRPAVLEASGRMSLERMAEVAAAGVDYISVGALTHSVSVFDLGLDLRVEQER